MKECYAKWYSHPLWQKKRLEIMERDRWKCVYCGEDSRQLHVHHKSYIYGHKPWEYENDNLITLCSNCHEGLHNKKKVIKGRNQINGKGRVTVRRLVSQLRSEARVVGYPCTITMRDSCGYVEQESDIDSIFENLEDLETIKAPDYEISKIHYGIPEGLVKLFKYCERKEIDISLNTVNELRSENGGYTRKALKAIGVEWPPEKGWKKKLNKQIKAYIKQSREGELQK